MHLKFWSLTVAVCALAVAAGPQYQWNLPKGFPVPAVPPDNPMSAAKAELGRNLFYDTRLSVDGKHSCASCHKQELAFTDGRATAIGATGEPHPRGSMSLVNVAYAGALGWNNPNLRTLEEQALVPMFGDHPIEMGLRPAAEGFLLRQLQKDPRYPTMFAESFPGDSQPVTVRNIVKAIATFERTIISGRSPYDRYHYDRDDNAVSAAAKHGEVLFFSQPLSCFRCHGGFNFSDATVSERTAGRSVPFHNTATANEGAFRTPTLRDIAVTAPYMHDGSIATLEGVLDHYASGGKAHDNPGKDPIVGGFTLSLQDRADLIEFLKTLTDDQLIHDPRFSDPRGRDR